MSCATRFLVPRDFLSHASSCTPRLLTPRDFFRYITSKSASERDSQLLRTSVCPAGKETISEVEMVSLHARVNPRSIPYEKPATHWRLPLGAIEVPAALLFTKDLTPAAKFL